MKIAKFEETVALPEGATSSMDGSVLSIKGPKGEVSRDFRGKMIKVASAEDGVKITFANGNKRHKTMLGTTRSHIKNMIKGATEGHEYKLKICSGHFPMNVAQQGNVIVVNNFLGEKKPREIVVKDGAEVKIEGDIITVTGIDKELVAQTAASLEKLTTVRNKDLRIFQDGIYITHKDGNPV